MKYPSLGLIFAALLSLASTPLFARTPDGTTPSGEDVCDGLLGEGTTPGLYGLCVAYCEAQDCDSYPEGEEPPSCRNLLETYDRNASEGDPAMPCAQSCPCWFPDEFEAGGLGEPLDVCIFGFPSGEFDGEIVFDVDILQYGPLGNEGNVVFAAAEGACWYRRLDTSNPLDVERFEFEISPGEEDLCRFHITELSMEWDRDGDPSTNCILIP